MTRLDVLMITYKSAGYVELSLPNLLRTCGDQDRVWLWHNGDDEETLESLRPYLRDKSIAAFHHSRENVRLREPTNWMWSRSTAQYVSKVDDDCLVTDGWIDTFAAAFERNPALGVIGSWRHLKEDYRPELAKRKIVDLNGGHRIMRNLWVQGSGYMLAQAWRVKAGQLRADESFTGYCLRLAQLGAVNGYYYPFVREDHMDDPRSPNARIHTDTDLQARLPLSAQANGVTTVAEWTDQLRRSAILLQSASVDPRHYTGWRRRARSLRRRVANLSGNHVQW